jgi:DivIVA domain-containing protein
LALDRQTIEKRDFPVGRRGYDTAAVDAHLKSVADLVEAFAEAGPSETPASLATAASDQVRAIVEAAEATAAEIERAANSAADRTRDDAESDARRTRAEAGEQAREHVARVSEATAAMLERIDAMESEIGALGEALRTGAHRLTADLALLEADVRALGGEAAPVRAVAAEQQTREVPAAEPTGPVAAAIEPEPEFASEPEFDAEPEPAAAADDEGARLIAFNMALNGTPRDETDRYLAENFQLPDRARLLDEVYAQVS